MKTKSQQIHEKLSHPVIDSDGHWREFAPIAQDFIKEVAGPQVAARWATRVAVFGEDRYGRMSQQEKLDKRAAIPPWWGERVTNSLDVATSYVPKLMHDRLEQMGIDFAVLYPSSLQLFTPYLGDEELRQSGCRALNRYAAHAWKDYSDRCTPVGVIPMATPQEAIAEMEHCKQIGLKAIAMGSLIRRPIETLVKAGVSRRYATWLDVLGLDSLYDYDPVWRKCEELGFAPSFHSASEGHGLRSSLSNWSYNHMGHFAEAGNAVAKALYMGGVTRRFPNLRFAFLEGGVAWACALFSDILGHWEKRNGEAIEDLNPARHDFKKLAQLITAHGGHEYGDRFEEFRLSLTAMHQNVPENLDDFAALKARSKRDLYDMYVPRYFFGCEADDATTTYAFAGRGNPMHAKFGAILASDISHWDVIDMTEVLEEAWELVEDHGMSEEDFRAFTFGNPVSLWTGTNPDFFKGTAIEAQVSACRAAA